MSWTLVFLIYTAHGAVHRDILHGYGSKGDCQIEGSSPYRPGEAHRL